MVTNDKLRMPKIVGFPINLVPSGIRSSRLVRGARDRPNTGVWIDLWPLIKIRTNSTPTLPSKYYTVCMYCIHTTTHTRTQLVLVQDVSRFPFHAHRGQFTNSARTDSIRTDSRDSGRVRIGDFGYSYGSPLISDWQIVLRMRGFLLLEERPLVSKS